MTEQSEVAEGDVVQLAPNSTWPYALAVVSEVRDWGIIAMIYVTHDRGELPAQAPVRLQWLDFARIGKAAWEAP
jgi:hypothetical protein